MGTINTFEDLEIWKLARLLCKDVFLITNHDFFSKDFGLKNQINNSSGSVMDNIAEGFDRDGTKKFIQFLSIAKASCGECRSQLYRAVDRAYITNNEFEDSSKRTIDLGRKISNLMDYLRKPTSVATNTNLLNPNNNNYINPFNFSNPLNFFNSSNPSNPF